MLLTASLKSSSEYLSSEYQFVVEFLEVFKTQVFHFWLHFLPKIINSNYYKMHSSVRGRFIKTCQQNYDSLKHFWLLLQLKIKK